MKHSSNEPASAQDSWSGPLNQIADVQLQLRALSERLVVFRNQKIRMETSHGDKGASALNVIALSSRFLFIERRSAEINAAIAARIYQIDQLKQQYPDIYVDLNQCTSIVKMSVEKGDYNTAETAFKKIIEISPVWLEQSMMLLWKAARASNQIPLLFDLILKFNEGAFLRLDVIGKAVQMGMEIGRRDEVVDILKNILKGKDNNEIRFGPVSYAKSVSPPRDAEILNLMTQIKYKSIETSLEQDIFHAAKSLSKRLDLDPEFADFIFPNRSNKSVQLKDWENQVKMATCIEHIQRDAPRLSGGGVKNIAANYNDYVDHGALNKALSTIDTSGGLLLVSMHAGLFDVGKKIFRDWIPDGVLLRGKGSPDQSSRVSVSDNPDAALMMTFRLLMDKKKMLVYPDGPYGNLSSSMDILGKIIPVALGPAFLAYETRCECAWFIVVRDDDRFLPVVAIAPKPEHREKFEDFATRWFKFYAEQITAFLTGDAGRIAVRRPWSRLADWDR